MNCKQGDLAVVVVGNPDENLGRIIRVTKRAELRGFLAIGADAQGATFWEFEGNLICKDGFPADAVDDSALRPIRDNDGTDEVIAKVGKPKAKPIIVSTDEEAARIAETVPNSHIKVVIRGVVVSEYYGQSQSNRP